MKKTEINLPRKFKYGGDDWDLMIQPFEGKKYLGEIRYDDLQIQIESAKPDCIIKRTVLHEIIHLVTNRSGIEAYFDQEEQYGLLELIADGIANQLFVLFKENPDLLEIFK